MPLSLQDALVRFLIRYLVNLIKIPYLIVTLGGIIFALIFFLLLFSTQEGRIPDESSGVNLFLRFLGPALDPTRQGNFSGGLGELGTNIYRFLFPYLSIASLIRTGLQTILQRDIFQKFRLNLKHYLQILLAFFGLLAVASLFAAVPVPMMVRFLLFAFLYVYIAMNICFFYLIAKVGEQVQITYEKKRQDIKKVDAFSWGLASVSLVIMVSSFSGWVG